MKRAAIIAIALLAAAGGAALYDYQADAHIAIYKFLSKEQRAERAVARIKATPETKVMLEEVMLLNNKLSSGITMNELSDKAAVIKTKAQIAESAYIARDDFEKQIATSYFRRADFVSIGAGMASELWRMTLKCYRDSSIMGCKSAEGIVYLTEIIGENDKNKLDGIRTALIRESDKDAYVGRILNVLSSAIRHNVIESSPADLIPKQASSAQEKKE
jgi:hypothetical protein